MRNERFALLLAGLAMLAGTGAAEAQERIGARRAWLGITYRTTIEGVTGTIGSRTVIEDVHPDSPADRAGVQPGDVILRWNGETNVEQALRKPPRLQAGDTVRLRLRRGSERDREVVIVATERPTRLVSPRGNGGVRPRIAMPEGWDRDLRVFADSLAKRAAEVQRRWQEEGWDRELRVFADSLAKRAEEVQRRTQEMFRDSIGPRLRALERELPEIRVHRRDGEAGREPAVAFFDLGRRSVAGAELSEMSPELASYFGTDRGALVLRVAPGTPAARAGLQPGDVVLRADDSEVASATELRRALVRAQERRPREVELEVLRTGRREELRLGWE